MISSLINKQVSECLLGVEINQISREAPCMLIVVSFVVFYAGSLNKVVVGILEVKLELQPKLTKLMTDEILSTQHSLEKANRAQRERLFITYAKRWWDEYLQIRDTHSERLAKIFARVSNMYS